MNVSYVRWVTIDRAAELTGYTIKAIRGKIATGLWAEGVHWKHADDNRVLINLEAYDEWVEQSNSKGSRRARRPSSLTCAASA